MMMTEQDSQVSIKCTSKCSTDTGCQCSATSTEFTTLRVHALRGGHYSLEGTLFMVGHYSLRHHGQPWPTGKTLAENTDHTEEEGLQTSTGGPQIPYKATILE